MNRFLAVFSVPPCGLLALMALGVLASSLPAQAQPRSAAFEAGLIALRKTNDIPLAIGKLREALDGATSAEDRATIGLVLGLAYQWQGQTDEAISAYRAVVAYNPELTVSFREYKLSHLDAEAGLGDCYWAKGDATAATQWWEKVLRRVPDASAIVVQYVGARKKLVAEGAAVPPFVMIGGLGLSGELRDSEGSLLVSASDLAESLSLKLDWEDGEQQGTLSNEQHRLVFTLDKHEGELDNEPVTMTPPPTAGDDGPLVPLRFVAETFGHRVKWDANTRIAWVG